MSPATIDISIGFGASYRAQSAEQEYQRQQAKFCGNFELARTLENTTDPVQCRRLAHTRLTADSRKRWRESGECRSVLKRVLERKFAQNKEARGKLLATGTTFLMEAVPGDFFWSSGLDPRFATRVDPREAPGQNWTGLILMRVRDQLQKEKAQEVERLKAGLSEPLDDSPSRESRRRSACDTPREEYEHLVGTEPGDGSAAAPGTFFETDEEYSAHLEELKVSVEYLAELDRLKVDFQRRLEEAKARAQVPSPPWPKVSPETAARAAARCPTPPPVDKNTWRGATRTRLRRLRRRWGQPPYASPPRSSARPVKGASDTPPSTSTDQTAGPSSAAAASSTGPGLTPKTRNRLRRQARRLARKMKKKQDPVPRPGTTSG